MASKYIKGRNINIYILRGPKWIFTACATNLSVELTAEEILITTADSGQEDEYAEGGATNMTGTMDGIITTDQLGGWQYEEWMVQVGTKINLRIDFMSDYGDLLRYQMMVLVTSVSAQADANDFGTFSVSFKRSGAHTVSKVFDNILVDLDGDPILTPDGDLIRV